MERGGKPLGVSSINVPESSPSALPRPEHPCLSPPSRSRPCKGNPIAVSIIPEVLPGRTLSRGGVAVGQSNQQNKEKKKSEGTKREKSIQKSKARGGFVTDKMEKEKCR